MFKACQLLPKTPWNQPRKEAKKFSPVLYYKKETQQQVALKNDYKTRIDMTGNGSEALPDNS